MSVAPSATDQTPPTPDGDEPPAAPPADRTFTQADVDRIVQERLARDRRDRPSDEEIQAMREAMQRLQEIEDRDKSELQRAQEEAQRLARERDDALTRANRRLIDAAVITEGANLKAVKPEHLPRLIDTDSVTVSDDGTVTGVQEAVKAFLDANPEYVGSGRPVTGSADQGPIGDGTTPISREALRTMSSDEIAQAEREGRLAHLTTPGR